MRTKFRTVKIMETASASFEPYANLAYVKFKADGFSEDGGAAALSSGDQSSDTTFTTLGLRASSDFMMGSMAATARGGIGWQHAFGDVTPETSLALTGGSSFAVKGTPIAKNAAVIDAGLDVSLTETATLGIPYQGRLPRMPRSTALTASSRFVSEEQRKPPKRPTGGHALKPTLHATLVSTLLAIAGCTTDDGYDGCHGVGCMVDDPDDGDQGIDDRPQFDRDGNPNFDTQGRYQGCHGIGCEVDDPDDDDAE